LFQKLRIFARVTDIHEQQPAGRFQHLHDFAQRLLTVGTLIKIIQGPARHHYVKTIRFEWKLPGVAGLDFDPHVHAFGQRVCARRPGLLPD